MHETPSQLRDQIFGLGGHHDFGRPAGVEAITIYRVAIVHAPHADAGADVTCYAFGEAYGLLAQFSAGEQLTRPITGVRHIVCKS